MACNEGHQLNAIVDVEVIVGNDERADASLRQRPEHRVQIAHGTRFLGKEFQPDARVAASTSLT